MTSVFEEADDAFSQRIVVGVANGSDREIDLGLGQALGILDRQVLRSAVRVVNQSLVGMSSSQRVPPDQQQQQIDGQGRSNTTNLISSSSSAAYIPSSSFISTPAVSQQQQFRQQDQQQGQQMPLNEVALKTVAASAIRNAGSTSETLVEPPKKVRSSSRYFASPELIISFKAY